MTRDEKDGVSTYLNARGAGDKRIQVHLKSSSDAVTEVRIRVDTFGDESLSRVILDKARGHFPKS